MAQQDDFEAYVDPDIGFGVPVIVDEVELYGIFDRDYEFIDLGGNAGVDGRRPVVSCVTADLPPGVKRGSAVTVDGAQWVVTAHEPDGTGWSVLKLAIRKAS